MELGIYTINPGNKHSVAGKLNTNGQTIRLKNKNININKESVIELSFKTLDTFGYCQRPVSSLCVTQHNA